MNLDGLNETVVVRETPHPRVVGAVWAEYHRDGTRKLSTSLTVTRECTRVATYTSMVDQKKSKDHPDYVHSWRKQMLGILTRRSRVSRRHPLEPVLPTPSSFPIGCHVETSERYSVRYAGIRRA